MVGKPAEGRAKGKPPHPAYGRAPLLPSAGKHITTRCFWQEAKGTRQ